MLKELSSFSFSFFVFDLYLWEYVAYIPTKHSILKILRHNEMNMLLEGGADLLWWSDKKYRKCFHSYETEVVTSRSEELR